MIVRVRAGKNLESGVPRFGVADALFSWQIATSHVRWTWYGRGDGEVYAFTAIPGDGVKTGIPWPASVKVGR